MPWCMLCRLGAHMIRTLLLFPWTHPPLTTASAASRFIAPAPAPDDADPDDPDVPYRGWQRSASRVLDDRASAEHRRPSGLQSSHSSTHSPALSPPGCSLFAQSSPSTQLSSGSCFSVACGSLCHLLLQRCRCGRPLDAVGDHVAACPRSGVLRARGGPLERAAARVCREAGAAVATHVLVRRLEPPGTPS